MDYFIKQGLHGLLQNIWDPRTSLQLDAEMFKSVCLAFWGEWFAVPSDSYAAHDLGDIKSLPGAHNKNLIPFILIQSSVKWT